MAMDQAPSGEGTADLQARLQQSEHARRAAEEERDRLLEEQAQRLQRAHESLTAQTNALTMVSREAARQRRFAETLLDRLPAGVTYIDKNFVFRVVNPTLARFFDKPMQDILDHHVFDVLPGSEADVEAPYAHVRATLEPLTLSALPVTYRLNGAARQTYWDATILPYFDDLGAFDGWLVLTLEVSERVMAEVAYDRQKELFDRILANTPAGVAYLNRDLVFEWVNTKYAAMLRLAPEQLLGRNVFEALGPETADQIGDQLRRALDGEAQTGVSQPFRTTAGQPRQFYFDFTYQPIKDLGGEVIAILVLCIEVSARVEHERFEKERLEKFEESDRLKQSFLSMTSHELRTPLATIVGYAEFLEDNIGGDLTPTQREFVGQIQDASHRLEHLVDDLLDFTRIEAGTFDLDLKQANLSDLLMSGIASLRPAAEAAGVLLETEVQDPGLTLLLDPRRIGQVILNLASNAIKFTPPGGRVLVSMDVVGDAARITVSDTGIGVARANLPHLFEKFYQVDPSLRRERGGAGLGLSISKAIIGCHGGEMGVESELGRGSRFWFTLPLTPA